MGGNGHKSKHNKTRTESHRPRRQDSLEEGEIVQYEEYPTSSRRRGEQQPTSASGGRSSQRSDPRDDPSQRNLTSPVVRHSQPGGVEPEASSYFDPHAHHASAQGRRSSRSSAPAQSDDQYQTSYQHGYQDQPFYSAYPQQPVQRQEQPPPPTFGPQMTSSPLPTPSLPTGYPQSGDEQPRQSSYDAMSYGSSRQGTQGSVSGTSPELRFSQAAGQPPSSYPMARSSSEAAYRADASQAHLGPNVKVAAGGYSSAYSSAGQQWPDSSQYATTGDYTEYTREAETPAYGMRMDLDAGGGAPNQSTDPRYRGYPSESPYGGGYRTGGTASRPVRPGDIPPFDTGPSGQPPRESASSGQYGDGIGYGSYTGDYRGDPYTESYLPAQGQDRPAPLRRGSQHTSSSSTETIRDRDRVKYKDKDRHGDKRDEGSTDRHEQHGEAYHVGRSRDSHSSRSIQNVDAALGHRRDSRSGRSSYPADIPEEYEDYSHGSSGRRGYDDGRDYGYDDRSGGGSYGSSDKPSRRHHGGGGGSRRHRD